MENKHSTIIVSITAAGDRSSGKTTLLKLVKKAIEDAGYPVSDIKTYGDEVKTEKIFVTTQTTRTEWITKQQK